MGIDFNGDGRDDILWRHENGGLTNWLGKADGGFALNDATAFRMVSHDWINGGAGDFDGDGYGDIVWLNVNGDITTWTGASDGGFTQHPWGIMMETWGGWHVSGTGDFNGDGRDDILLRYENGYIFSLLGDPSGYLSDAIADSGRLVPTDWHVAGTGDFNGDGRNDILWRNENGTLTNWLGDGDGRFIENYAVLARSVPLDWHVVGTGDFNGDSREDIVWRNENGTLTNWLGTTTGGFVENYMNLAIDVATEWHVATTGDFNGDGRDDLFWRHQNGTVTDWLGKADGGFIENYPSLLTDVPDAWHVQATSDHSGLWL